MPKRQLFLIAACIFLTVLALVVTSYSARLFLAGLMLIVAAVWVATVLIKRDSAENKNSSIDRLEQGHSTENLAISSLLEATMTGMREGLLVVNKDMRVVVSNRAAQKLFNPSVPALKSQRLTELTRNPAIYSAFLDGLKGIERSGVKVETHGPERQIFDLRVVPIGTANGNGAEGALGVFSDQLALTGRNFKFVKVVPSRVAIVQADIDHVWLGSRHVVNQGANFLHVRQISRRRNFSGGSGCSGRINGIDVEVFIAAEIVDVEDVF